MPQASMPSPIILSPILHVEVDITPSWPQNIDWARCAQQATQAVLPLTPFATLAHRAPQLAIIMTDNAEIQRLNHQWRGYNRPTNVLAFPQWQPDQLRNLAKTTPDISNRHTESNHSKQPIEFLLGDIILAQEICRAEADDKNIPLANHVSHLIIHGFLHLIGYDHQSDNSAQIMEDLEIKTLAKLAIANPYKINGA